MLTELVRWLTCKGAYVEKESKELMLVFEEGGGEECVMHAKVL